MAERVSSLEATSAREKEALAAQIAAKEREAASSAAAAAAAAEASRRLEASLAVEVARKEQERAAALGELEHTKAVLGALQQVDLPMWRTRAAEATGRLEKQEAHLKVQNEKISKLVRAASGATGAERDSLDALVQVAASPGKGAAPRGGTDRGVTLEDVIKIAETSLIGQRALSSAAELPPPPASSP